MMFREKSIYVYRTNTSMLTESDRLSNDCFEIMRERERELSESVESCVCG